MQKASQPVDETPPALRALLARHAAWWRKSGLLYAETPDSGLGSLWLPLADGSTAQQDITLTPEMLDVERLVGPALAKGDLRTWGDIIQTRDAYLRIPWVEAILGCPIRTSIQGGAMRAGHLSYPWKALTDDSTGTAWLELLQRMVRLLVERSGGQFAITHTLMRGTSDLAEAALGPELMCLSQYDHPAELRVFLERAAQRFIAIWRAQCELIPQLERGYVNWFGIWAPGTTVRTQCDASALLSPEQYRDWYLPYDNMLAEAADYAVIHLHSGSLHTVEALLQMEKPQAIQISLDPQPSGPPLEKLLPVFRHILQVKSLIIDGALSAAQVAQLLDKLPSDGLCIIVRGNPEQLPGL
ncbi:MAG: hypothetical protein LLG44_05020 [Chloroflexi bacterium]|nr:hypothetical protein [Chloroflexota bacterium]